MLHGAGSVTGGADSGTHLSSFIWLAWAVFPWVNRPERETFHSFPSSAEIMNASSCTSAPPQKKKNFVVCPLRDEFALCW
jgi:hypothetical protein